MGKFFPKVKTDYSQCLMHLVEWQQPSKKELSPRKDFQHLVIREAHIKTIMRFCFAPNRVAVVQKKRKTKSGHDDVEKLEIACQNVKWCGPCGK